MYLCKYCGSANVVKNGYVQGKQRYLCRDCERTSRYGDGREKYSVAQRIRAVKLYTEGMGLRGIERVEGVSASLLVHWIRNFSKLIRQKLCTTEIPEDSKDVEILEMDELFTYFQKKATKPMYGLLWTETGIKLLISR